MKSTQPLFFTLCFAVAFPSLGGELDRYMEWQNRRDYEQRQDARRNQMNAVVDGYMDSVMQANNARANAAIEAARQNPSFETEVAALQACLGPYMNLPGVAKDYFNGLRALHEKWGVEYDDTAEREYMEKSGQSSQQGPRGGGTHHGPQKPRKPPKPSTKTVIHAAEAGLDLAGKIANAAEDQVGAGEGAENANVLTEQRTDNGLSVIPAVPVVRPGQKHPVAGHVVLSPLMEWVPEPGYDWNIPKERRTADFDWVSIGVHWQPGMEHSEHPHVIAADREGTWKPAEGWRFASNKADSWAVVPK